MVVSLMMTKQHQRSLKEFDIKDYEDLRYLLDDSHISMEDEDEMV